jgi:hypothetical protein
MAWRVLPVGAVYPRPSVLTFEHAVAIGHAQVVGLDEYLNVVEVGFGDRRILMWRAYILASIDSCEQSCDWVLSIVIARVDCDETTIRSKRTTSGGDYPGGLLVVDVVKHGKNKNNVCNLMKLL